MNPFNFKIEMSHEQRIRRRIAYTAAAVVLTAVFAIGFITVYKNCYNSMNSEPMTVFRVYKNDNGLNLIFLNHKYCI